MGIRNNQMQKKSQAFHEAFELKMYEYLQSQPRSILKTSVKMVSDYLSINDKAPDHIMKILDTLFENHILDKMERNGQ